MSCAPVDRIMQTLRVHAPGATDAMLELELFNVADEFFRRTSAWRYPLDIMLSPTQTDYPYVLPADTEFVRMISVEHNGQPVGSTAQSSTVLQGIGVLSSDLTFPDGDAAFHPDASNMDGSGVFTWAAYRPGSLTISAAPAPDQVQYPLALIVALTVAKACLEKDCGDWGMPDWAFDMFFHELVDGTLGRLYLMPAKPWANKEQGAYHAKRFRDKMGFRKQEANKGFTYGLPGWRFPLGGGWVR